MINKTMIDTVCFNPRSGAPSHSMYWHGDYINEAGVFQSPQRDAVLPHFAHWKLTAVYAFVSIPCAGRRTPHCLACSPTRLHTTGFNPLGGTLCLSTPFTILIYSHDPEFQSPQRSAVPLNEVPAGWRVDYWDGFQSPQRDAVPLNFAQVQYLVNWVLVSIPSAGCCASQ